MNQDFDLPGSADKTVINQPPPEATQVVSQPAGNVTQMAATVECPVCKTVNPTTEVYCSDCGFLLGSTPSEVEIAESEEPAAQLVTPDGREFTLRAGLNTIGRVDSDILFPDPTVSRKHAEINYRDGGWWLTDLGSTNGTFLDGVQIAANQPVQLVDGASLKFGAAAVSFKSAEAEAAQTEEAETTVVTAAEPELEEEFELEPYAAGEEESETVEAEEVEVAAPDTMGESTVEAVEAEEEPVEPAVVESEAPALAGKLINVLDSSVNFPVVTGVNTIGRAPDNTIQIVGDPYVSGRHARIECSEDGCTITDVGSTNGTLLNGNPVPKQEPQTLNPGDEVSIGQGKYRFEA